MFEGLLGKVANDLVSSRNSDYADEKSKFPIPGEWNRSTKFRCYSDYKSK